ncbi:MAG: hypothetical protein JXA89_02955, partial [Anaerolineae bacterium]|nr:hypothetical protein [Anaerolineae bacterium]
SVTQQCANMGGNQRCPGTQHRMECPVDEIRNRTVLQTGMENDHSLPQLIALIDTLKLITEQVRAYERALPQDNYQRIKRRPLHFATADAL